MPFALRLREAPDLKEGVGIIDIGSNSVRLVVYAGPGRTPIPIFNEKVLCGLGRSIASTGELDPDGVERALGALARFRGLTSALGIQTLDAVATAAVREAANGPAFIKRAEDMCGTGISILSGADEARLAAEGVIAGSPNADGVVGDLGGGSLELVEISHGRHGDGATMPVGPLRLIDMSGGSISKARDIVAEVFDRTPFARTSSGGSFFAVGGNWRNIARLHMAWEDYPLRVLHAYRLRRSEAMDLARLIAGQSRKSLDRVPDVSRRRLETLPFAAVVLEKALQATGCTDVVVSAYGVREGLLFSRLTAAERAKDPLLNWARAIGARMGRFPEVGDELERFTAPVFKTALLANADAEEQRLHTAACHLSDMGWRIHPDYRSQHVALEILRAPVSGIDHPGRIYLSLAVANRYRSGLSGAETERILALLDPDKAARAAALGQALRLGHTISAGAPRLVTGFRLQPAPGKLNLLVPSAKRALLGESVTKRLTSLAKALGLEPDVEVTDN